MCLLCLCVVCGVVCVVFNVSVVCGGKCDMFNVRVFAVGGLVCVMCVCGVLFVIGLFACVWCVV